MEHYLKTELYELIKKDETIFEFIQEGLLDGLWYWDLENPENEWMNPRLWKVLGYNPNEMPHKASAWQEIINQDDLKLALEKFHKHIAAPQPPYDQEVRYTHKNGSTVWVRCRGLAIRDKDGKPIRMLGAHQDITVLKQTELQLIDEKESTRKSQEKYQLIFETAANLITSVNGDGIIVDCNKRILDILGYEKAEIIGQSMTKIMHPDYIENAWASLKIILSKGSNYNKTYKMVRKDGTLIDVQINSSAIKDNEGKFIRTICIIDDITERKEAELKLKESELKYRFLAENTSDVLRNQKPSGEFLYISPNIEELTGYTVEEYIKFGPFENTLPKDHILLRQVLEEFNQGANQLTVEYRANHKSGEITWIQTRVKANRDETGKLISLLSSSNNITDRKIAELELKKQSELFELVINSVPARIFWKDLNSTYLGCNTHFAKDAGLKNIEDVIGKDDNAMVWKENVDEYRADDQLVINTGVPKLNYEEEFISCEGNKVVWRTNKMPLKNTNDEIIGIIATSENITEEKKAADELKHSEEKFKDVFEYSNVGMAIGDNIGNVLEVNDEYLKILGYTRDEFLKFNYADITHPEDFEQEQLLLNQLQESRLNSYRIEKRLKRKDGKYAWLNCAISVKNDDNRNIHQLMVTVIDITENKISEQKILQQNEDYEALNEELLQTNSELVKSKVKAEEGNRLKTEFLHNMSHEIRTPMNGIIGFSDLLSKIDLNKDQKNYYTSIIKNSSKQLLRIIDDILEISTLETKQINVIDESFCLNDFINELFSVYDLKSKERKLPLYIKKKFRDTESQIISDKSKLHKILTNLLDNAFKFTNDGFIELGYHIKDTNLILYVKDTGKGISPKNKEKIFNRFSQEDSTIAQSHGGLGLGLSIAKENAQLLDGDIFLESKKGSGSIFSVSIPYNPTNINTDLKNSNSTLNKSEDNKTITILVAEDEEVNYLYIETVLQLVENVNYKLLHAINGKEAVEICLSNNTIDLVLMDIKMPIMNGYLATEKIKETLPDMPVIAQTAYSTRADRKLALSHGFDEFISKPINKDELISLIETYLNN